MISEEDLRLVTTKAELLGSLLKFTQVFFKLRTGIDFMLSHPISQESHHIQICRSLTDVFEGKIQYQAINIPPRYTKTEIMIHFIAWAYAHYPNCNNLYISNTSSLAEIQTATVRNIMMMPHYKKLFGVEIRRDSSAKDEFETTAGGKVKAAGVGTLITGRGAGIFNCDHYGGAIFFDDLHNPHDVASDSVREREVDWLANVAESRRNAPEITPIIGIGQITDERDIFGKLRKDPKWKHLIIPVLDNNDNPLWEEKHSRQTLIEMREKEPYIFAAQYMQCAQPAGGGLFKPEWFVHLDKEPNILATFITADTAETDKTYNDATALSFWGLYRIKHGEVETDTYGLHWLSCLEIRVETADLENEFMNFYYGCMRHPIKPTQIIIEKKSSGVTLSSTLSRLQGFRIIDSDTVKSKISRFIACQKYVASRQVSFTRHAEHADKCIEHCRKITANNTHAHDDIADTLSQAIFGAFIDKTILSVVDTTSYNPDVAAKLMQKSNQVQYLKSKRYGNVR